MKCQIKFYYIFISYFFIKNYFILPCIDITIFMNKRTKSKKNSNILFFYIYQYIYIYIYWINLFLYKFFFNSSEIITHVFSIILYYLHTNNIISRLQIMIFECLFKNKNNHLFSLFYYRIDFPSYIL